jgi:hypothetical protein
MPIQYLRYIDIDGLVQGYPYRRHRRFGASEHPEPDYLQALSTLAARSARSCNGAKVIWGSRFRVHHRIADSYQVGRVAPAGDAAHVHSPAGGQGRTRAFKTLSRSPKRFRMHSWRAIPSNSSSTRRKTRDDTPRRASQPWWTCPRGRHRGPCLASASASAQTLASWAGVGHGPYRAIRCWSSSIRRHCLSAGA